MVKFRMRTKIMAVVTFLVMSAAVIFGGYDIQNAEATGGTDYVKYTYATGQTQTYNLPDIPTVNYASYSMRALLSDYIDPRPDADYEPKVVEISGVGTGFIIGEHEIMTAAHCVYGSSFGSSCTIKIPDDNPYSNSSTVLNAVSAHVPQDFLDYKTGEIVASIQDVDYAIITVTEDLSQYGMFLLGMGTDSILNNTPVHCIGYWDNHEKISDGKIVEINKQNNYYYENNFKSNLYAYYKTSGAPIYVESLYGIPGTSNSEYQIKTYKTAISIVSTISSDSTYGRIIDSVVMQFAYDNDYL